MIQRVCVYCASSSLIDKLYFEATEKLALQLVTNKVTVVYGGGGKGLMGQLATTIVKNGGRIIGIMPDFMKELEWAHKDVKEFHFVADMHARKKKFLEETDALIALPGGCGTLEELLEVITLKRLGLYTNPIIILNTNNFYDPLLQMLDRCIKEKFMSEKHRQIWTVISDPDDIIKVIENTAVWSEDAG